MLELEASISQIKSIAESLKNKLEEVDHFLNSKDVLK